MTFKQEIRRFIKKLGYDVVRYTPASHPLARRSKLIENFGIEIVLDVGANTGQYGKELRAIGYKGRIISFEPLASAYKQLCVNSESDDNWQTFNFALGDAECSSRINIASNSYSSSILEMLPSHLKSAPESEYVGIQQIQIKTLDSLFDTFCTKGRSILLKIDTQGYEQNVLAGAEKSLAFINTIELEMSLVPLYKNQMLFGEMYQLLFQKGYRLVSIESGFADEKTGQLLQVDGMFHRF